MARKKKKNMFIDNDEMLKEVIKYKRICERAEKYGIEKPGVQPALGKMIYDIAENLSYRPNFKNYSFRDDMIMDGVRHVIRYIHTFNDEKYSNPFGWCTTILWQCYGNRIKEEKKHLYLKFKQGVNKMHEMSHLVDGGLPPDSISGSDVQYINDFIEEFEKKNGIK